MDDQYEEGQQEGQYTQPGGGGNGFQMPWWGWLLLIGAVLYLLSQFLGQGGSTPAGFDAPSVAYQVAQSVQKYRKDHSAANNDCQVVVVSESTDGKLTELERYTTYGYGIDSNLNHCEQRALRWIQYNTLPSLSFGGNVQTLHVLLFTQVRACDPCEQSFSNWQNVLQQLVKSRPGGANVQLQLYIWEIKYGSPSGFAPSDFPAGPYTQNPSRPNLKKPVLVRQQDMQQVYP